MALTGYPSVVTQGSKFGLLTAVASGFLLLGACSFETLSTAETDLVLTIRAEDQEFDGFKTYALGDRVVDLCEAIREDASFRDPEQAGLGGMGGRSFGEIELDPEDCIEVSHTYDALVLETIESNMAALGYRRVEDPSAEVPDVVLFTGYVAQNNFYLGTSVGWCDPYYYYYGCYYPSYTYVYNLPTGALVVDMVVVDDTDGEDIHSAWTFVAQGYLAESSEMTTEERLERAIDQAFEQSPYLDDGGEQ